MYGPYGHHWFDGWFMMLFVVFFWVLLLAGITALVIWLVARSRQPDRDRGETALDILQKRYARGEISREEYERMKLELSER